MQKSVYTIASLLDAFLAGVEHAARLAGRLTQQMLRFARRQFHDARFHDLNRLVGELDSLITQPTGKVVALDLAPAPLPVRLDAGHSELAVVNLVRTAAEAVPECGCSTSSARAQAW